MHYTLHEIKRKDKFGRLRKHGWWVRFYDGEGKRRAQKVGGPQMTRRDADRIRNEMEAKREYLLPAKEE